MQELIDIYRGMRAQGIEARRALEVLRPQIAVLAQKDQAELVRQIRALEYQEGAETRKSELRPKIKPISQRLPRGDAETVKQVGRTLPIAQNVAQLQHPAPTPERPPATVNCPHCGQVNAASEALCSACGRRLHEDEDSASTRRLTDEPNSRDGYFGNESVLVLMVRGTNISFKLRPQKLDHDIIIGRSDASIKPDVDLTNYGAAGFGVSRMHVRVHYDPEHASLSVMDMNTVNGTYINGVQIHPQEVRVLRHSDELRLGQLVLTAHFYFAET